MTVRTQRPGLQLVFRASSKAVTAQLQRIVEIMETHHVGSMETASDVAQRLWTNGPRIEAVELAILCDLQEQADGTSVQRILGGYVTPNDGFDGLAREAMDQIDHRGLLAS